MASRYECNRCQQTFRDEDATEICVFYGTREEPAEFDHHCPHCNSSDIEYLPQAFCNTCGDNEVKYDGDKCTECVTIAAEERADAIRHGDHRSFP